MTTQTLWIPASTLGILYPGFVGFLLYSARYLPDRPAVHFNLRGAANGWLGRPWYLLLMFLVGTALSFFQLAVVLASKPESLHVPHAEYWLAPERVDQTTSYLSGHALWLACFALVFVAGLHLLIVRANRRIPPHLSTSLVVVVAVVYAVGIISWENALKHHFSRQAHPQTTAARLKAGLGEDVTGPTSLRDTVIRRKGNL